MKCNFNIKLNAGRAVRAILLSMIVLAAMRCASTGRVEDTAGTNRPQEELKNHPEKEEPIVQQDSTGIEKNGPEVELEVEDIILKADGDETGMAGEDISQEGVIPTEETGPDAREDFHNVHGKKNDANSSLKDQAMHDSSENSEPALEQEELLKKQALLEEEERIRREREELEKLRLEKEKEEREKREREERLNRKDPERNMFFRRDVKEQFGYVLKIRIHPGSEMYLARNNNPTQFYGGVGTADLKFDYIFPVNGTESDITELVRNLKGSYVILLKNHDGAGKESSAYRLAEMEMAGKNYLRILNIFSDGKDLILVDGEESKNVRQFFRWSVDRVLIER